MLQLTTLGALDLRDADGRALRDLVAQPKRIALLVHLAVESARGPVTRDRLLALLWPESDESRARNALSQTLYHLRQALGADAIVGQGATLTVAPAALHCDAVALETALAAGDAGAALDHYAGPFCPGLIVAGATAFDEWVSTTRLSQRTRLFALARQAVGGAAAAGDVHGAASLAHRALALMPDDERDVRFHMEAIGRAGDVPGALKRYAEYARRLATELELAPDPETVALAEAMRAPRVATPAAVRAVPVGDAPSADAVAPPTPGARRPAVRRSPSLRAAVLAAGVVVGLAWTIAATARAGFAGGPDALRASRTVAVFPFTVRGSAASAFLADGMSHLLATKLDGTDVIRAIDPRSAVLAAEGRTPEPARGATLAHDLGARFYVLGDVAERAGRLQLDGALFDAESPAAAIATASVTGDSAALFSLVDELAGRLLAHLLEGRDRELTQLAAMTTSSLPALKAYLRGERAMREGRDAAAAAAFREAVAEDPTFALAWYRIAILSTWVVIPGIPESLTPISRAEAHADRLTPLGRDLVHAFLLYRQGDFAVREAYRRIVLGSP
ncbi:MAG: hypothetical protein K1X31_02650, partial [Gemmatimonadaceae bacterium]|nr:hypothetical protein [Gemmatimonadaceae bacterium]